MTEQEAKQDQRIGQLMRNGKIVFYAMIDGQKIERSSAAELQQELQDAAAEPTNQERTLAAAKEAGFVNLVTYAQEYEGFYYNGKDASLKVFPDGSWKLTLLNGSTKTGTYARDLHNVLQQLGW